MVKQRSPLALIALVVSLADPASLGAQASWTQVGMLNCTLAPSVGFIVGGQQRMSCQFVPSQGLPPQQYTGVMTNAGIDIGVTAGGALAWAVLSPIVGPPAGGLAGTYVGASGDVSVGIGGGINVLVGGSARSVALQPVSLEGTAGLNLDVGLASLVLSPAPVRSGRPQQQQSNTMHSTFTAQRRKPCNAHRS
jgi:hypothetical protein